MYNFLKLKFKSLTQRKISYSYNAMDSLLLHIFRNKNNGIYIDIGCNHPIKNNNTYLLNKKGWSGINIDADKSNIEIFDHARPHDYNINIGVSDKIGFENFYHYHNGSAINTMNKKVTKYQKAKVSSVFEVKTTDLNTIIEQSPFKDFEIDFLNIDVEGNEFKILDKFLFSKYPVKVIVVEFLDLSLKRLEIKNLNINNVIKSDLYKLMIANNYTLANWLHSDLVFINNNFRD